jgi:hypothetical protein
MPEIARSTTHVTHEIITIQDDKLGIQVFELETAEPSVLDRPTYIDPETSTRLIAAEEAKLEDISGEVRKMRMQGLSIGLLFSGAISLVFLGSDALEAKMPDATFLETASAVAALGGLVYLFAGELRAQQYKPGAKKDNIQIGKRIVMLIKHTNPAVREDAQ